MKKYVTISGDTWDKIAHKVYGDGRFTHKMIEANREYVTTFIFTAGTELQIPELPKNAAAKLPPWKGQI